MVRVPATAGRAEGILDCIGQRVIPYALNQASNVHSAPRDVVMVLLVLSERKTGYCTKNKTVRYPPRMPEKLVCSG